MAQLNRRDFLNYNTAVDSDNFGKIKVVREARGNFYGILRVNKLRVSKGKLIAFCARSAQKIYSSFQRQITYFGTFFARSAKKMLGISRAN